MLIKSIMVKELVDATGYLVDVIVGQLQGLEGTQTFSKTVRGILEKLLVLQHEIVMANHLDLDGHIGGLEW